MEEEEKRQHDSSDTAALPVSDVSAREIRRRKLAISQHSGAKLGLIHVADDTIFSFWYWVYQWLFSQQQSQDDLFQRRTKPKNYILSTIYSMMTIFITAVTRWSITTAERSTCVAVHAVWEVALHLVVRSIAFQIISHISHNSWVSYTYIAC